MFSSQSLVPLMLLAAFALGFPRQLMDRRIVQTLVLAGFSMLFLRYYSWRVFETVLPATGFSVQTVFVWFLFLVETLGWIDAGIGFLALSRRTDRRAEADGHETRLRRTAGTALPVVDVMIATYNEPLEVLEKTIIGALALDWPRDRLRIWVLDDGRRDWLAAYCAKVGAGYLTRRDNLHAKAGNINAAILRTSGEFFLVLDADFVPRRNFLYRAVGFFQDPTIGIVQIPHNFFNNDPMQSNLKMQRSLPDDQRFFFDAIMPGRDGWDCAFCCGSNGIVRRSAMEAIGNALPSGSITEDMLLTMALLRKGYKTRYLNERLAVGLAPESLSAFFVQRARWARGAIQMLYLKEGPLGPGLTPVQRLMFLPTHWISQSFSQVTAMCTPAIYLLTGVLPLLNATTDDVLAYQLPAILGAILTIRLFAPWQYYPLAATVHGVLQAFRLLPTILVTLVKPYGHAFKVTPKGSAATGGPAGKDRPTIVIALALVFLTAIGLIVNANSLTRVVDDGAIMPVVAFWAILNMVVLLIVSTIAVSAPIHRSEERFEVETEGELALPASDGKPGWRTLPARTHDISLSGARLSLGASAASAVPGQLEVLQWTVLDLPEIGPIPAQIMRRSTDPQGRLMLGVRFHLPYGRTRAALIESLFAWGVDTTVKTSNATAISVLLIRKIFGAERKRAEKQQICSDPPPWARDFAGHGVLRDAA